MDPPLYWEELGAGSRERRRNEVSLKSSFMWVVLSIVLIISSLITSISQGEEIFKRKELLMGTVVEIVAYGEGSQEAVASAFAEIGRVDSLMSNYIKDSELAELNSKAGKEGVVLSEDTFYVIKKALEYSELTDSAFDVTISPLVKLWGFEEDSTAKGEGSLPPETKRISWKDKLASIFQRPSSEGEDEHWKVPKEEDILRLKKLVNYRDIIIVDENRREIKLARSGTGIDLGGIAKGYAVDRACEILRAHNIEYALVNAGGDIRVLGGKPDGKPWRIGIQHPRYSDSVLDVVEVKDKVVVTSGDYERYFIVDGRRYHHILDPGNGYPASRCMSVTIVTNSALKGDALATGVFVLGPEKGMELIERLPEVEGLIVASEGNIEVSSGLKLESGRRSIF